MKIRVTLKVKSNTDGDSVVDITVSPSETVASVKDKVTSAQLIPFPERELTLDGKVLSDECKLRACGVQEGSSLTLEVKATEATLTQQLTELLEARDMSPDELGMLYCYKHSANISQALKILGFEGKLQDFVAKQKSISMENGSVAIVRTDTAFKPFSAVDEVVQILKASETGRMEIKELCTNFVQKFSVSLSSIVGCRPVEFLSKEKAVLTVQNKGGRSLVSLKGFKSPRESEPAAGPPGLGGDAPPGLGCDAPPGLGGPPGLDVDAACPVDELPSIDCQQFVDLHNTIHSRPFNSKVVQTLNDLVGSLSDASFFDIDHVVIGGSVGKGTAISGVVSAEVVLFLGGLPMTAKMASLLKAFAGVIDQDFQAAHNIGSLNVTEDCIKMNVQGANPIAVDLYLSSTYENYQQALQLLAEQSPDKRKPHFPGFAKERTQFVSRQPSSVKITIRLMKWWRNQQEWYGHLSRPSDEIIELAAIYSAVQTKPEDQKQAIANLMSLLSRFDQMRVVWSNYYSKDDVWAPLLRQRPLLMDPTNPFVNVADANVFDASELMVLARTTHFFW